MRIPLHFVLLPTGSIGHLVQDYEKVLFEINRLQQKERFFVFYMRGSQICNEYFLGRLLERHQFLPRIPFVYLHRLLLRMSKAYRQRDAQIDSKRDSILHLIHSTPPPFFISERDQVFERSICQLLSKYSVEKYVCLVARDLGFDRSLARDEIEMQKQSLRHTPLTSFLPTIRFLNQIGYLVVRLGRHNDTRLENLDGELAYVEIDEVDCSSTHIADFQAVEDSHFLISTGAGIDCLGLFYRKPVLYVNLLSASAHPESPLCKVGLLPTYYDKLNGTLLTFDEVISDPICQAGPAKLRELDILIFPKSPSEILRAVEIFVRFSRERTTYTHKNLLY